MLDHGSITKLIEMKAFYITLFKHLTFSKDFRLNLVSYFGSFAFLFYFFIAESFELLRKF